MSLKEVPHSGLLPDAVSDEERDRDVAENVKEQRHDGRFAGPEAAVVDHQCRAPVCQNPERRFSLAHGVEKRPDRDDSGIVELHLRFTGFRVGDECVFVERARFLSV